MKDSVNAAVEAVASAIDVAEDHIGEGAMASSALLALQDAHECLHHGDLDRAGKRTLDSLRYSVGILHVDYARCAELLDLAVRS